MHCVNLIPIFGVTCSICLLVLYLIFYLFFLRYMPLKTDVKLILQSYYCVESFARAILKVLKEGESLLITTSKEFLESSDALIH